MFLTKIPFVGKNQTPLCGCGLGSGAGCGVRVRVRDTCGGIFTRTPREIFCIFYENKNQFIVLHKTNTLIQSSRNNYNTQTVLKIYISSLDRKQRVTNVRAAVDTIQHRNKFWLIFRNL